MFVVAAGQFVVSSVWEENAQVCVSLMAQAAKTRRIMNCCLRDSSADDIDLDLPIRAARPLDGAFYDARPAEESMRQQYDDIRLAFPSAARTGG